MKCPVCNRNLAPTLSICFSCGAMVDDTVREELQGKIARSPVPRAPVPNIPLAPPPKPLELDISRKAVVREKQVETASLRVSQTSQTLVDFQPKAETIPEWRLQIQNAVRQRKGATSDNSGQVAAVSAQPSIAAANGSGTAAARASVPAPKLENADPRLEAALKRLNESRRTFGSRVEAPAQRPLERPAASNSVSFGVVSPKVVDRPQVSAAPRTIERPKPALVEPIKMGVKLDTNKLPKIDAIVEGEFQDPEPMEAVIEAPLEIVAEEKADTPASSVNRIVINSPISETDADEYDEVETDDIEDLAPLSLRVNAGLFDLIVGIALSMLVLSPFVFAGGEWFTPSGILTFSATCALVLFIYMTASIGFMGRTFGMRLFSLEIVDAEENEYPTIHQAAVSTSLFILSLIFGGIGFLTVFFNEERRTLHDLLSGTIIVREF